MPHIYNLLSVIFTGVLKTVLKKEEFWPIWHENVYVAIERFVEYQTDVQPIKLYFVNGCYPDSKNIWPLIVFSLWKHMNHVNMMIKMILKNI